MKSKKDNDTDLTMRDFRELMERLKAEGKIIEKDDIQLIPYKPKTTVAYMGDDIALRHYNCMPFVVLWFLLVAGILIASFVLNVFALALLIPILILSPNPFKYDIYIRFYPVLNNTYRHHWRFKFLGMDFYIFNYKNALNFKIFSPKFRHREALSFNVGEMEKRFSLRTM